MTDVTLTSEQKQFLEECEEEFKDRYTEKDSDCMNIKMQEPKKPPIISPWHGKHSRPDWSHRNQNYDRRNRLWDRRNERNERNERLERHAGKRYMHHRQRMY